LANLEGHGSSDSSTIRPCRLPHSVPPGSETLISITMVTLIVLSLIRYPHKFDLLFILTLTKTASSCDMFEQRSSRFFDELHLSAKHAILHFAHHYHDDTFFFPED
jgi:hypothetical protein